MQSTVTYCCSFSVHAKNRVRTRFCSAEPASAPLHSPRRAPPPPRDDTPPSGGECAMPVGMHPTEKCITKQSGHKERGPAQFVFRFAPNLYFHAEKWISCRPASAEMELPGQGPAEVYRPPSRSKENGGALRNRKPDAITVTQLRSNS